jgi:hypothetical protein
MTDLLSFDSEVPHKLIAFCMCLTVFLSGMGTIFRWYECHHFPRSYQLLWSSLGWGFVGESAGASALLSRTISSVLIATSAQEDSVLLWKSIVQNPLLKRTNLVLFLNKCDILKAKLASGIKLGDYIVSYGRRPNDFESGSQCEWSSSVKIFGS